MKEGKRIYVASVLTDEEYKNCARTYPSCFTNGSTKPPYFQSEFDWRYRIGEQLSEEEIKRMNNDIKILHNFLKNKNENSSDR